MEKKLVTRDKMLYTYDINGKTLEELITGMKNLVNGKDPLAVDVRIDYDGDIELSYKELETDEEYTDRIDRELITANAQKKRDIEMLAKLKKKYPDEYSRVDTEFDL